MAFLKKTLINKGRFNEKNEKNSSLFYIFLWVINKVTNNYMEEHNGN